MMVGCGKTEGLGSGGTSSHTDVFTPQHAGNMPQPEQVSRIFCLMCQFCVEQRHSMLIMTLDLMRSQRSFGGKTDGCYTP